MQDLHSEKSLRQPEAWDLPTDPSASGGNNSPGKQDAGDRQHSGVFGAGLNKFAYSLCYS